MFEKSNFVPLTTHQPPKFNPVKDCELDWWPSDSEESFTRLSNTNTEWRKYIEQQGWHRPGAITYRFNSMGYRGTEPQWHKPVLMTFGCSITMGIGLPQHLVWPWLLGKALDLEVVNFSLGGMSADWCFRMAEYWVPQHRPVLAVMLAPPHERVELVVNDQGNSYTYSAHDTVHDKFLQIWFSYSENVRLNTVRNKLAFKALCDQVGIKSLFYDSYDWFAKSREEIGFARDYMHGGPPGHEKLAEQIVNDWNEIKHT